MMLRITSVAACLALAAPAPLLAQDASGDDGEVNLESVDALLGGSVVTEPEDDQGDAAEEAGVADGDEDGPGEDTDEPDSASGVEAEDGDEEPTPSDLTLAFNAYSLCASEAGEALEGSGFALDQIGQEALLRCSGERAGYVNAFYFSMLSGNPNGSEASLRASAENLVAQSDSALMNIVTADARALRDARTDEGTEETETPADAAPADSEQEDTNPDA